MNPKSKLLIFEGIDNIGKDTVINELKKEFKCKVIHFSSPEKFCKISTLCGLNVKEIQLLQFETKLKEACIYLESGKYAYVILNRSHIGEYVYSPLYRKSSGNWVFDLFEHQFKSILHDAIYILLTTSNFEFNIQNDDGLSHTNTIYSKQIEQAKFLETLEKTLITNKYIIDTYDASTETWVNLQSIVNQLKIYFNECNR